MRSHSRPYSGPVLATRPHRTLKIQKTKRKRIRNDRVTAVPKDSHRERELQGVADLPPEVKEELESKR